MSLWGCTRRYAGGRCAGIQTSVLSSPDSAAVTRAVRASLLASAEEATGCHPRLKSRPVGIFSRFILQTALYTSGDLISHTHPGVHPSVYMVRPGGAHVEHHPMVHEDVRPDTGHIKGDAGVIHATSHGPLTPVGS